MARSGWNADRPVLDLGIQIADIRKMAPFFICHRPYVETAKQPLRLASFKQASGQDSDVDSLALAVQTNVLPTRHLVRWLVSRVPNALSLSVKVVEQSKWLKISECFRLTVPTRTD